MAASALDAAWIMVFHLLLPSILMPVVSLGVWPSGSPRCGLTRLWQGSRQVRIAGPPSSCRVLPSRDVVPAGTAAVFGHNRHLAVQFGRSALVGGHNRSSVSQFQHSWRNVATATSSPEMRIKAGRKGSPMTCRVLIDYQARGWGGEERTDDPERVLRHPLCWNRTKSRRWRPRLGDRVVLRGERLRSANQGQVGIRRPPHKRQTPRHAPIRLPHAGFVPQLGWPCVVLVRFCAESAFRSSVSRRQRRISAETREFGHHPHLQKNPQALGVKFYSPAWLIMGSHAAGILAMCQSPNFTSPPRRQ